jgi:hypothetical protein
MDRVPINPMFRRPLEAKNAYGLTGDLCHSSQRHLNNLYDKMKRKKESKRGQSKA